MKVTSNPNRPLRWRIGDSLDEWAHRHGFACVITDKGISSSWYWYLTPCRWLCNRRELSYGVPKEQLK